MLDTFLGGGAGLFTVMAALGTLFFLVRVILLLVAGHGAHDLGVDTGDPSHPDSSEAFKVLSIQSIAAFMMGFGWGALGAYRGTGWEWGVSAITGVAVGAIFVWILAWLLKGMHDLQSSGNVDPRRAIGLEGDVYVSIPASGARGGQVRLVIGQRDRIYGAVTGGEAIPVQSRVRVIDVESDHTMRVERA